MYNTEPSFIELGLQFGLYFFILWVGIYMAAMEASDWPREEPQIDYGVRLCICTRCGV